MGASPLNRKAHSKSILFMADIYAQDNRTIRSIGCHGPYSQRPAQMPAPIVLGKTEEFAVGRV